jgi:hypothetical protein
VRPLADEVVRQTPRGGRCALFFHILGALTFVSGIVVVGIGFETARRRVRPAEIALLLGLTRIGVLLVGVGGALLLGFGLWLVQLGHFGFAAGWIQAALSLFVVAMALGAIGGQRPKQASLLASRLAAEVPTGFGRASGAPRRPRVARDQLRRGGIGCRGPRADGVQALNGEPSEADRGRGGTGSRLLAKPLRAHAG